MSRGKVVAVGAGKGGVGKTALAVHVAAAWGEQAAARGDKVLLVDLDNNGTAARAFGLPPGRATYNLLAEGQLQAAQVRPGLWLLAGGKRNDLIPHALDADAKGIQEAAASLRALTGEYCAVVLDTPPRGWLQKLGWLAAHSIVVPVVLEQWPMQGMADTLAELKRLREDDPPALALVPSMADMRYSGQGRQLSVLMRLVEQEGVPLMPFPFIRRRVALAYAAERGCTVFDLEPDGDAAQDYRRAAHWLWETTVTEGAQGE